ncbi:hypothetical protein BKA69DRAFT_1037936 [Paraphysoderma sedebokerense]|nr:hypothetical protein BKA69DRAFT_1037936 [Paraphysoderma sedebokerense]
MSKSSSPSPPTPGIKAAEIFSAYPQNQRLFDIWMYLHSPPPPKSGGVYLNHMIDTFKGITLPVILMMIIRNGQWSNKTAWLYLAIHGTYGMLWVSKSFLIPDKRFIVKTPLWHAVPVCFFLSMYWAPAYFITSRSVDLPAPILGFIMIMYTLGIFIHFCSDYQKHIALECKGRHLIKTGLWSYVRNINYFGELLIYLSFALLAGPYSIISILYLSFFIPFYWYPNMLAKDKSLSKYPEFSEYKKNSWLFIPFLY